jgi:hypothetical protein
MAFLVEAGLWLVEQEQPGRMEQGTRPGEAL